ncbi:MAG: polysaccharide pyruvyl transferase family protein [Propioniciclava sp.]|uniref:polysaccharide pyruvyl transferase family protein n=1 Tax=Propioniciclava sp. TaxID=2038686 RepID=UPI0039E336EF
MRVIILHGYSADNIGDGMLVTEAIELIRSTFARERLELTLCASDPESFDLPGVTMLRSKPGLKGYDRTFLDALRHLDQFDLVVGVGGGYLRGGHCIELAKALLVQGPQLTAAAKVGARVVYLPQSIGPLRLGSAPWFRRRLRKLSAVWARDDRTVAEIGPFLKRAPDMAVLRVPEREPDQAVLDLPVMSVRNLRGGLPAPILDLATRVGRFDGYVQSQTGSNQDAAPMKSLDPVRIIQPSELLNDTRPKRVVIAVRLHAALMALQAGHYVIHLAYERKGFAAFADLGIGDFVHNAFSFEPAQVVDQMRTLLTSATARADYDAAINHAIRHQQGILADLAESLTQAATNQKR